MCVRGIKTRHSTHGFAHANANNGVIEAGINLFKARNVQAGILRCWAAKQGKSHKPFEERVKKYLSKQTKHG